MALSFTTPFDGLNVKVFEVISTADADAVLVIPHGLQRAPFVSIAAMQQAVGELSAWAVTAISATDITIEKSVAVGSGDAAAQLRVNAFAEQARQLG